MLHIIRKWIAISLFLIVPFILHYWPHYKDDRANNCYIVFISVVILWISRIIPAWTAALLFPLGFSLFNVVKANDLQSSSSIILSLMFQGPILQIISSFALSIFVEKITISLFERRYSGGGVQSPTSPVNMNTKTNPNTLTQYPILTSPSKLTQLDFESQQNLRKQETQKIGVMAFPFQVFFLMITNILLCSVMTNVCAGRLIRNVLKSRTKLISNEDSFSIENIDNQESQAISTASNVVVLSLCASSNIGAFLTPISSPLAIVANGIMPMSWSDWLQYSIPITALSFFLFYIFVILPYCMPGYYRNKDNPLVQGGHGILVKIKVLPLCACDDCDASDSCDVNSHHNNSNNSHSNSNSNTNSNSETNKKRYFNCFIGYTLLIVSMLMCYIINSSQPINGRELTNLLGIYSIIPLVLVFTIGDLDIKLDIPWDLILLCMATLPLGEIAKQTGMIAGMKEMIKKRVSFLPFKLQFPVMLIAMMIGGTLKSHLATGLVILPPTLSYVQDLSSNYNFKWLFICCLASISAGSYLRQSTLPNEDVCRGECHDGEDEEGDDILMERRMNYGLELSSTSTSSHHSYDIKMITSKHLSSITIPQGLIMISVAIGNSIYALSNKK